ncbi:hypothetical protein LTR28_001086 [Elasticomyces elasticus]|nr:hypothetical protein LTR28_001086 [Elasticomyces elasticus]
MPLDPALSADSTTLINYKFTTDYSSTPRKRFDAEVIHRNWWQQLDLQRHLTHQRSRMKLQSRMRAEHELHIAQPGMNMERSYHAGANKQFKRRVEGPEPDTIWAYWVELPRLKKRVKYLQVDLPTRGVSKAATHKAVGELSDRV